MKEKCIQILKELTNKNNIFFTDRGNSAIEISMKYCKSLSYNKIYLPDQGGWLTYPKYANNLKYNIEIIKTNDGFINLNKLKIENNTSIIINSMAAYSFLLDLRKFAYKCKKKKCFLINDVSASIGTEQAKEGDLIIGSFGRWKPLDVEYGGFIATNNNQFKEFYCINYKKNIEDFYKKLYSKLKQLKLRLKQFKNIKTKITEDLKNFDIIHRDKEGINVIIKYHNEIEKEKLINYCSENNLEYTLCPRDIRVNCNAISIEVKRLK